MYHHYYNSKIKLRQDSGPKIFSGEIMRNKVQDYDAFNGTNNQFSWSIIAMKDMINAGNLTFSSRVNANMLVWFSCLFRIRFKYKDTLLTHKYNI